jgi:hypothetical protein
MVAFASVSFWCPILQAEWYVAGEAGLAIDGTLQDSKVTSPTLGGPGGVNSARVTDLDLMNSGLYGAKRAISSNLVTGWDSRAKSFARSPTSRNRPSLAEYQGESLPIHSPAPVSI